MRFPRDFLNDALILRVSKYPKRRLRPTLPVGHHADLENWVLWGDNKKPRLASAGRGDGRGE
ncbi:hypothetical protein C6571_13850 [Simplicispira suum]|uniref:Uncharacterized protein n=1 Tax=Simplicispira suum TaxID=2109915 RepID=A0A2S0N256_9BURK|nr:hypothetical protein C6571_13850 [Simplicispira suum]